MNNKGSSAKAITTTLKPAPVPTSPWSDAEYNTGAITTTLTVVPLSNTTVSPKPTVTAPIDLNSSSTCLCACGCQATQNETDMTEKFDQIIAELVVPKNETSQRKRKLTSAGDARPSSRGIGVVGIVVLTAVLSLFVIADARFFLWNLTLSHCFKFRKGR